MLHNWILGAMEIALIRSFRVTCTRPQPSSGYDDSGPKADMLDKQKMIGSCFEGVEVGGIVQI